MESTDRFTFTIDLTSVEIRRFLRYVNPSLTWQIPAVILAFIVVILSAAADSLQHSNSAPSGAGAIALSLIRDLWLLLVAVVALFSSFFYVYRRGLKEMMPGLFLPTTFTVLDEGLLNSNERGELMQCWKSLIRFVETKDDFFVMFAKGTGRPFPKPCSSKLEEAACGHILPKRCFPTLEAAALFANQVRLNLEKHAPAPVAGA